MSKAILELKFEHDLGYLNEIYVSMSFECFSLYRDLVWDTYSNPTGILWFSMHIGPVVRVFVDT